MSLSMHGEIILRFALGIALTFLTLELITAMLSATLGNLFYCEECRHQHVFGVNNHYEGEGEQAYHEFLQTVAEKEETDEINTPDE